MVLYMDGVIIIELQLLWHGIYAGLLCSMAYQMLNFIRMIFFRKKWEKNLLELLFWIVFGNVVFCLLNELNHGIVRGFFVCALGIGMGCGYKILEKFIMKPLKKMKKKITIRGHKGNVVTTQRMNGCKDARKGPKQDGKVGKKKGKYQAKSQKASQS